MCGGGKGALITEEASGTLSCNNDQTIFCEKKLYENHGQDSRLKGPLEVSPTVQQKFGAGGNNTPLVTNRAHEGMTVRRLTPLECERLQGYRDGWTALPAIEDMTEEEYEFWKAVLLEKAEREGKARLSEDGVWEIWRFIPPENEDEEGHWENAHKQYKDKTKKQMVAWYNRSFCKDTDGSRYRAMGNSIALPSWRWVLKRISAMYEREATMASLFDGVGGFPLIWEQINGKGSCLWASEIELFPIAVTRYRFGE